jgi:hypothetical protein
MAGTGHRPHAATGAHAGLARASAALPPARDQPCPVPPPSKGPPSLTRLTITRFQQGTFEQAILADAAADALMSIDAFQYTPDKRAAFAEFARIMRPGAGAGIVCYEVDPAKAQGLPVLGTDPVAGYRPLITAAGLNVEAYEETPGWQERACAASSAIIENNDTLAAEMGERAAAVAVAAAEAKLTAQLRLYPRRILAVASRLG